MSYSVGLRVVRVDQQSNPVQTNVLKNGWLHNLYFAKDEASSASEQTPQWLTHVDVPIEDT